MLARARTRLSRVSVTQAERRRGVRPPVGLAGSQPRGLGARQSHPAVGWQHGCEGMWATAAPSAGGGKWEPDGAAMKRPTPKTRHTREPARSRQRPPSSMRVGCESLCRRNCGVRVSNFKGLVAETRRLFPIPARPPSHLSLLRRVKISEMLAPCPAPAALPGQESALLHTHPNRGPTAAGVEHVLQIYSMLMPTSLFLHVSESSRRWGSLPAKAMTWVCWHGSGDGGSPHIGPQGAGKTCRLLEQTP